MTAHLSINLPPAAPAATSIQTDMQKLPDAGKLFSERKPGSCPETTQSKVGSNSKIMYFTVS